MVNCTDISTSMDQTSIQIMWDTIHTGGLNITSASIEYAPLTSPDKIMSDNFTSVVNYSSLDPVEGKATLQNSLSDTANVTYNIDYSVEVTAINSYDLESEPASVEVNIEARG